MKRRFRLEAKVVFLIFLVLELLIIGLVILKGTYTELAVQTWQLWTLGGLLLFIYILYLKFRTQTVERHVVDEKIKTHTLLEALPHGIVVLDEDWRIISANPKGCELLGVDRLECLDQNFLPLVSLDPADTSYGRREVVTRGGRRVELGIVRVGDTQTRVATLREPSVQPQQVTPSIPPEIFTSICNWIQRISQAAKGHPDPELQKGLSNLLILGRKGMNFCGPEGLGKGPSLKRERLIPLIQGVLDRFQPLINWKGLKVNIEGQDVEIMLDHSLFERALEEVILNSCLYTPKQGEIKLKLDKGARELQLSVTDSGAGIVAEELPRVFDQGFRGSTQPQEVERGAGMGLYWARQIVEAHGGSIWIESQRGRGTRVCITIPAR
jgi:PAS domain-containing protein/anti-sigma regulatory factor (Ser/Thr protein kinase)